MAERARRPDMPHVTDLERLASRVVTLERLAAAQRIKLIDACPVSR
jgi:hypothetical protein